MTEPRIGIRLIGGTPFWGDTLVERLTGFINQRQRYYCKMHKEVVAVPFYNLEGEVAFECEECVAAMAGDPLDTKKPEEKRAARSDTLCEVCEMHTATFNCRRCDKDVCARCFPLKEQLCVECVEHAEVQACGV